MRSLMISLIAMVFMAGCGKDPVPTPNPNSSAVLIGTSAVAGQTYSWSPTNGLADAHAAQTLASPSCTTTYEVTATSNCGVAKSKMVLHVYKREADGQLSEVACKGEI